MMGKVVKWDGFPKEYRDNSGSHYLIELASGEEVCADYCPFDEEWSGPNFMLGRKNTAKHYSYSRPYTITLFEKELKERDLLIRDLRKELNERRYGRSA